MAHSGSVADVEEAQRQGEGEYPISMAQTRGRPPKDAQKAESALGSEVSPAAGPIPTYLTGLQNAVMDKDGRGGVEISGSTMGTARTADGMA